MDAKPHNFDALILGAGAAGLLCAIEAGKRGRRIAVLERSERAGRRSSSPAEADAISRTSIASRKTSSPPIHTSPSPRFLVTRLRISSLSSKNTASPTTKKHWASFSATAPRMTSQRCWNRSVAPLEWRFSSIAIFERFAARMSLLCAHNPENSAPPLWLSRPEGFPFRKWAPRLLGMI